MFWIPSSKKIKGKKFKYKLSLIGTNHDDRLEIVKKVIPQMEDNHLNYFFRIFVPLVTPSIKDKLKYFMAKIFCNKKFVEDYEISTGIKSYPFVMRHPMTIEEVNEIIEDSETILDTDRESQRGVTPRAIWALAQGKKVISTNQYIGKEIDSDISEHVSLITRENPIIDVDFINKNITNDIPNLEYLRIDKWVEEILK